MDGVWPPQWAAAVGPQDVLLQYGAIGAIAVLLAITVRALFKRQVQQHDRDIARADRAEQALETLNALIREQVVAQLTRATDAIARVSEMLAEQRRNDDRRGR